MVGQLLVSRIFRKRCGKVEEFAIEVHALSRHTAVPGEAIGIERVDQKYRG